MSEVGGYHRGWVTTEAGNVGGLTWYVSPFPDQLFHREVTGMGSHSFPSRPRLLT